MAEAVSRQAGPAMFRHFASLLHRSTVWIAACASDRNASVRLVVWFALAHAALWTVILTILKSGQNLHFDVTEAYAWGQTFLLGYGKHPPLSGWIAGLWFRIFPAADWAAYALAMATVASSLVICWFIALRVVDRRRAFLTVVVLAIYPIFNFKGFKYNADLLQLVTLPLIVLAYLDAFAKRTTRAGVWLGLAAAAGLMTKYWAVTMIGTVGLVALLHPDRRRFLGSPAPWVAIAVLGIAMLPHLWWLIQVGFLPLIYAHDFYAAPVRSHSFMPVIDYLSHNLGLLLPAIVMGWLALGLPRPNLRGRLAWTTEHSTHAGIRMPQALNVWLIQPIVAIGPPVAGWVLSVYLKSDWGIPVFFLTPLALIAIPSLAVKKVAAFTITAIWLVLSGLTLAASPIIAARSKSSGQAKSFGADSEFAAQLTEAWHTRFHSRWRIVVGFTEFATPVTFYSPDHPAPLVPDDHWSSGLTSFEEAKRLGFIGICDPSDGRLPACEAWMAANAANSERLAITTQHFFKGSAGPSVTWKVYIVPPGS